MIFPLYIAHALNTGVLRFVISQSKGIVVACVTGAIAYMLRLYQLPDTWGRLFVNSSVTAVTALCLILVFDKRLRVFLLNFLPVNTRS